MVLTLGLVEWGRDSSFLDCGFGRQPALPCAELDRTGDRVRCPSEPSNLRANDTVTAKRGGRSH